MPPWLALAASLAALAQTGEEPAAAPEAAPAAKPAEAASGDEAPPPPKPKRRHKADAGATADVSNPEAPKVAEPAPSLPDLTGASSPDLDRTNAQKAARAFFLNLIEGDARRMVQENCAEPFFVEDKRLATPDELLQEWLKHLRDKRTDLLTLYGIDVLTPQEMEKKYGKPPARLVNFPWKAEHTYVAVANLSGHAAVVLVRLASAGWRVVGYHD